MDEVKGREGGNGHRDGACVGIEFSKMHTTTIMREDKMESTLSYTWLHILVFDH